MKTAIIALVMLAVTTTGHSQDRDLSDFRTAGKGAPSAIDAATAGIPDVTAKPTDKPRVISKADLFAPPSLLPARTFSAGSGFARIQRRGRGLDFTFNDARFDEAITEIAKTFDTVVVYAGDADRRIIGRYSNISSAAQLLALLTDMTDLVVVVTKRGFIIQQLDTPRIPTLDFNTVINGVPQ